jgi:hypothetical protein
MTGDAKLENPLYDLPARPPSARSAGVGNLEMVEAIYEAFGRRMFGGFGEIPDRLGGFVDQSAG